MTEEQELKVENSRQLTSVALVLLPAIGVVVGFVLQFRVVGSIFWSIAVGAALLLAGSLFCGGLGVSRLRRGTTTRFSLFNLQAVFCLFGFVLIISTYFAIGDPRSTDVESRIDSLDQAIGANGVRLGSIESRIDNLDQAIGANGKTTREY